MIDKKKEQQKKLFHRRLKVQQLSRNKMKNTVNENHLFKQKKKKIKKYSILTQNDFTFFGKITISTSHWDLCSFLFIFATL